MSRLQTGGVGLGCWIACLLLLCGSAFGLKLGAQSTPKNVPRFHNPVIWEDLADVDILRVGDAYFYSASNMHYSPGAPILRSYDLVHWEYVGHSLPRLDFGPDYDMQGGTAYVRGSWASFLGFRKSNQTFYWGGCIDFKKTYIYTAPAAAGPWQRHAVIDHCYYDAGLLIDDDNTMYVAYGNTKINVAQLSPDATTQVKTQEVFRSNPEIGMLEGSRFYKIHGNYYIFTTHPPDGEYVLRSTNGPFGPYTIRKLILRVQSPIPGGGSPHQGGIVQTQSGAWYYMAFTDAYPGGRVPVLAPLTWDKDGWPSVELADNAWGTSYPLPIAHPAVSIPPRGDFFDNFSKTSLSPEWEWNHNPDNTKWSAGNGLTLRTATVTDNLYRARNTLTHRIPGPASMATVAMDTSAMKKGDFAGLAMLRDSSAMVGVRYDGSSYDVVMEDNLTMDKGWKTFSDAKVVASVPVQTTQLWFRVSADIRPGAGRIAVFSFSTDGKTFRTIGEPFVLNAAWPFFMGYRFAIFNYATQSLGGAVRVKLFHVQMQRPGVSSEHDEKLSALAGDGDK